MKVKRKFDEACVRFGLIEDGDRILVGLSGGKDSLALVTLLGARARIFKPSIRVEAAYVVMDNIPYESDVEYLEGFCRDCGVALHVIHTRFDESRDGRKTRCFLCARYRRRALFDFAVERGFNKVALGHHQDDILETLLMNLLHQGAFGTMPPRLRMDKFAMEIIRPLCLVEECDLKRLAELQAFHPQLKNCPYEIASARTAMKGLLAQLEQLAPDARHSLWGSMTNIQSDYLPIKVQ